MHRVSLGLLLPWTLTWALVLTFGTHVIADDAQPPAAGGDVAGADSAPVLRDADDAEAKPLVTALKKAARAKSSIDVKKALDAIASLKHDDFIKPLIKLMGHDNARAAGWAGASLQHRVTKDHVKVLWKKGWSLKQNKRRFTVRTKVLRAFGQVGHALDKKQFQEVKRAWERMLTNPHKRLGPALADICWYFGRMKDKRLVLEMAFELDQPGPDDPGASHNPPTEWWEKRVTMWQGMHEACITALHNLTGVKLTTRAAAKKWFQENEATFGVKWRDW